MEKDQIIKSITENYLVLSNNCIDEFFQCSRLLKLDKSHVLVKEGAHADKAYFISNGAARAYYLKDGRDISDWFAFENEFISSIVSFFSFVPSPHFIETTEPSTLLEINRENLNHLSQKYRDFDQLVKMVITNTMLKQQHRIASIQFETAQQKYDNLLAVRPDITQRISLTHIASYLGITIETLSRIRNPKNRI